MSPQLRGCIAFAIVCCIAAGVILLTNRPLQCSIAGLGRGLVNLCRLPSRLRRRRACRVMYGPRWEQQALAVAANLSEWEWKARQALNMAPGHPERLVRGNDLAHLEDAIWPDGEWLEQVAEGEDADGQA